MHKCERRNRRRHEEAEVALRFTFPGFSMALSIIPVRFILPIAVRIQALHKRQLQGVTLSKMRCSLRSVCVVLSCGALAARGKRRTEVGGCSSWHHVPRKARKCNREAWIQSTTATEHALYRSMPLDRIDRRDESARRRGATARVECHAATAVQVRLLDAAQEEGNLGTC